MGESEWAVKADALVLQYSAADDIDEAILNMGEQIDRLRTENAKLKARSVPLRIEFEPGYPEDVAFGTQRQMDRLKKWLDNMYALKAENATLRELVREAYDNADLGWLELDWEERAEKALKSTKENQP